MRDAAPDVASLLAGLLVLASLLMSVEAGLPALPGTLRLHGCVAAVAVAWQAHTRAAPALYVAAIIILAVRAALIPRVLRRCRARGEGDAAGASGRILFAGVGLLALSFAALLPGAAPAGAAPRAALALALTVVLLGLLVTATRRDAVGQLAGFVALANGIDLAAATTPAMPHAVALSLALTVLVAALTLGAVSLSARSVP